MKYTRDTPNQEKKKDQENHWHKQKVKNQRNTKKSLNCNNMSSA